MSKGYKKYEKPENDGRIRLLPSLYEEVIARSKAGESLRALGRAYNVDRHTIKAIVDPEWYKKKQKQRYDQKMWEHNYDKEAHKLAIRKYRAKKKELGIARLK